MNVSSLCKFVRAALIDLAGQAIETFARRVAEWVMERVERLAESVAARLRDYAESKRARGVPEEAIGPRLTDHLVDALDALRADLITRREHLTAEEAVSLFEQQMALPQLA